MNGTVDYWNRARIVKYPPSEARLVVMVKRLHTALNSDDGIEIMYAGDLLNSVRKMDKQSQVRFKEAFNALGGKVVL